MPARILAVGEVLWDVFADGPRFGGAAANWAVAAAGLGGEFAVVQLASAVGRDALGDQARDQLVARGVDVSLLARADAPTGQVFVELDAAGQGRYRVLDDAAWDRVPTTPALLAAAAAADVIYFGPLGQRAAVSRETIRAVLRAARPECWRILDVNLRPPHTPRDVVEASLALANVVKLNTDEWATLAAGWGVDAATADVWATLGQRFALRLVAETRGAAGSVLHTAAGRIEFVPDTAVAVIDTVGAGDAFTAALALGLAGGVALDRGQRWASAAAAYVCTQPGGTPAFPPKYGWRSCFAE
jgi:fructokinase